MIELLVPDGASVREGEPSGAVVPLHAVLRHRLSALDRFCELDDPDPLQTAQVQWKLGSFQDALVWLRRAVDSAIDAGHPERAAQINRLEASLAEQLSGAPNPFENPFPPGPLLSATDDDDEDVEDRTPVRSGLGDQPLDARDVSLLPYEIEDVTDVPESNDAVDELMGVPISVDAEPLERAMEVLACLARGARAGLGRQEEVLAVAVHPCPDAQLGVAVPGGRVDVVDAVTQQHLERAVGVRLARTRQRRAAEERDRARVSGPAERAPLDHGITQPPFGCSTWPVR